MSEAKIDIDFLLHTPGTAVYCATREEARQFLGYMKKHYPDWCKNWDEDETRFNSRQDGICYTFYWNNDGEWRKETLMHDGVSNTRDMDYNVVHLCELVMDTKELTESDQPVDALFGVVV